MLLDEYRHMAEDIGRRILRKALADKTEGFDCIAVEILQDFVGQFQRESIHAAAVGRVSSSRSRINQRYIRDVACLSRVEVFRS